MGLFSKRSEPAAAAGRGTAQESHLVSPGLPETHPRQLGYELLVGTGLGLALHGPGDVSDCFRELARVSPVLLESQAIGAGFGSLRQDAGLWMAWSGPSGSAIVYCGLPDSDSGFLLHHITDPIMSVRGRFTGDLICLGSSSSAGLVEIINTGEPVPVWDLPGLEHLRPAEQALSVGYQALAAAVRETLLSNGAEALEGGMVKMLVDTGAGRTQFVFVTLESRIHLLSPIARTENGAVPAVLGSLDPGRYSVDVIADLVMLMESIDDQVPMVLTVDDVISKAIELARYADTVEASIATGDDL